MKNWHWLLVGALLMLVVALLVRGDPTAREQAWLDSLTVERERTAVARRADSLSQLRVDSLEVLIGAVPVDSLATLTAAARQAQQQARLAGAQAIAAIGQARTLRDSADALIVALVATVQRAETAEHLTNRLDADLRASGQLLALTRQVQEETRAQRDTARAESGRWKLRAIEAEGLIERRGSFTSRIGRAAETVAIGAATYGACREGMLTVGCISGAVVTTFRFL